MIDIHTHILPGLDDGPKSIGESLKMAQKFAASGLKEVVATPHFIRGSSEVSLERLTALVREINEMLREKGVDFKLLPGMEIELFYEMAELFKQGRLLTVNNNGKYILIEPPLSTLPSFVHQVFYEFQLLGVVPIFAHPERNLIILDHIETVYEIASKGILIQVNAGSILGSFGGEVKNAAISLLKNNMVHVVASDAHVPEGPRGPCLHLVRPVLEKLIGKELAEILTVYNPQAIVEGREVYRQEPVFPKKVSFWGKIFGRK